MVRFLDILGEQSDVRLILGRFLGPESRYLERYRVLSREYTQQLTEIRWPVPGGSHVTILGSHQAASSSGLNPQSDIVGRGLEATLPGWVTRGQDNQQDGM